MKIFISAAMLFLSTHFLFAQKHDLYGKVTDSATHLPVNGLTVLLKPGNRTDITDESGQFFFKNTSQTVKSIIISGVGYQKKFVAIADFTNGQTIFINQQQIRLADVTITGNAANPYKTFSETDIKMRGVSNSQEVLRMVPGLFIGQHQGGGKAEQIFLRGFDNDHGTDLNLSVDGMPINMVSHAHGQGYADSHFIIPETIENTTYKKGMYDAEKGDLAVTGFVNFHIGVATFEWTIG